jgi:hypothetical protein
MSLAPVMGHGMTSRAGMGRPVSRRTGVLLVLTLAAVVVAVPTIYLTRKMDPARAEAVLDRLEIPADWRLANTEQDPAPISRSRIIRYYLVPGEPEPVAAAARAMLSTAGFSIEGRSGLSDCSSNHEPPATICGLGVALSDGTSRLELDMFDRRGTAFLGDAPWFAASAQDEIVVRVTVYY